MKILRYIFVLTICIMLFLMFSLAGFATLNNIDRDYFMAFIEEEYCDRIDEILNNINSQYISEVRELTNPDDYKEPYTPMLLITVNNANEDSFERATEYIEALEYVTKIVYEPLIGSMLKGDADGDGNISAADARFVLRCSVELEECNDTLSDICDMNYDGEITAADARSILRISVGLN